MRRRLIATSNDAVTLRVGVTAACDGSVASVSVASLELPPDHTAAAHAREFVARTLRSWGCDGIVADAELLVSELVTNAILHARSTATVNIEREPELRVSVCDHSTAVPRVRNYGPTAVTGRGMLLVDRISRRWGVDISGNGKCVWFEIDADAQLAAG
jgi:anti-sigma regulatory factor (Ser/Thr protein kinase)